MNYIRKLRADKTFLIEGALGDNPKLMGRLRPDGRITLYLEYYFGKIQAVSNKNLKTYGKNIRRHEILKFYLYDSPGNADQRRHNRQSLSVARKIRYERDQQLAERQCGYRLPLTTQTDMLQWMLDYYRSYTKSDARHIARACRIFSEYLCQSPLLPDFDGHLYAPQLTPEIVSDFTSYISKRFRGEGPHTLYARFKKIIKAAVRSGILRRDPCDGIVIKIDTGILRKDILSDGEISRLAATRYRGENSEVRRGFIFCLYTGLRWCDVRRLTYDNVDFSNRLLRFEQAKTQSRSSSSAVVIPLSPTLLSIIGKPQPRDRLIFMLPSRRSCQTALKRWTEAAGIDKHITWHCARHSFALRILNKGANIKTVAALLGHSSIRHTEKYTRAVDTLKLQAIMSLPPLHPEINP